jgi:hypothetical protein
MSIPNDFVGLLNYCNIECGTCLDTKYLWRERKAVNAYFDWIIQGRYELIRCSYCWMIDSDKPNWNTKYEWIKNLSSNEYFVDGQKVINWLEPNETKIEILKEKAKKIQANREIKAEKMIDKMNDGNKNPKYKYDYADTKIEKTEVKTINIQINQIMKKILALITSKDILEQIAQTNFNFTIVNEKKEQTESKFKYFTGIDDEGYPTFVMLKVTAKIIKKNGIVFDSYYAEVSVRYNIAVPTNNAAKEICEKNMANIIKQKIDLMNDFILSKQ